MKTIKKVLVLFLILFILRKLCHFFEVKTFLNEFSELKVSSLEWDLTFVPKDAIVQIEDGPKEFIQNCLMKRNIRITTNKPDTLILMNPPESEFNPEIRTILSRKSITDKSFTLKTTTNNYYIYERMNEIPKIIWSYWHSGELPELVTMCKKSWEINLPDYKINLLNSNNVSEYCGAEFIQSIKHLGLALQSDFIRLKLLYMYGGVWLDATTFVNKNIDEFLDKMKRIDLFFVIKPEKVFKYNIWESYFLIARKQSSTALSILTKLINVLFFNEKYFRLTPLQMIRAGIYNDYHIVYVLQLNQCYTDAVVQFCTQNNTIPNSYISTFNYVSELETNQLIDKHINKYKHNTDYQSSYPLLKINSWERKNYEKK